MLAIPLITPRLLGVMAPAVAAFRSVPKEVIAMEKVLKAVMLENLVVITEVEMKERAVEVEEITEAVRMVVIVVEEEEVVEITVMATQLLAILVLLPVVVRLPVVAVVRVAVRVDTLTATITATTTTVMIPCPKGLNMVNHPADIPLPPSYPARRLTLRLADPPRARVTRTWIAMTTPR
jgi:hypothetical protein